MIINNNNNNHDNNNSNNWNGVWDNKCALLVIKGGKSSQSDGIYLQESQEIESLEQKETYKYSQASRSARSR